MKRECMVTIGLALVAFHAVTPNHTLIGYFLEYEHRLIQIENDLNSSNQTEEVLELATHTSDGAAPPVLSRLGLVFCMTDMAADHGLITTVEEATTFVFQEILIF